jgi:hypothetical protein
LTETPMLKNPPPSMAPEYSLNSISKKDVFKGSNILQDRSSII